MNKSIQAQLNTAQAAISSVARSVSPRWAMVAAIAILAGCASKPLPPHTPVRPAAPPAPAPAPPAPPPVAAPAPAPAPAVSGLPQVGSMAEYRRRAAQLIMAANPSGTFAGKVPDPLYGIVVLTIAFNPDGSLKSATFLRRSSVGPDANNLAMDAVRRVGNFGSLGNVPGPWEFNETFFYNDARKFQLRTIVERL